MSINIHLSENIILTSIGLIASGYDLYNKNNIDILDIVETIKKEYKDLEVINYFKMSRTNTCEVNPYWPRGSAIYAASLFLTSNYEDIDLKEYLSFEKQANSSALWQDNAFINWIKSLPYYIRKIKENPATDKIIEDITNCIEKYEKEFKFELAKASEVMAGFSDNSKFQVVYIPNLLQADQCTDYIKKENILYVVATKPRFSSMIHEYLHLVLEPYRNLMEELYKGYMGTALFDKDKLSALGYLWDETLDSELRCLDEGFARSLTVLISTMSSEEKESELEALKEEGFGVADKFIGLIKTEVKEEGLDEIIRVVLT